MKDEAPMIMVHLEHYPVATIIIGLPECWSSRRLMFSILKFAMCGA